VRSLKFFHGLLQVSSRTAGASAANASFASCGFVCKDRRGVTADNEVMPATIGILSSADALRLLIATSYEQRLGLFSSHEMMLLIFGAALLGQF
jgi:hypothetical protein